MGKRIVITSGKGGVGKTTVTACLGRALASSGASVCVVDGDFGLNNLDVMLRREDQVVYGIEDVANGKCRLQKALIPDGELKNFAALLSKSDAAFPEADFQEILSELNGQFDFVLLDCPAGVEQGFTRAAGVSDESILVTTPHVSAVRDADRTLHALATLDVPCRGLIVNRVSGRDISSGDMMSPPEIGKLMRETLLGAVPESKSLSLYGRWDDPARLAFFMIASKILGKTNAVYDAVKQYRNPFYIHALRRQYGKKR